MIYTGKEKCYSSLFAQRFPLRFSFLQNAVAAKKDYLSLFFHRKYAEASDANRVYLTFFFLFTRLFSFSQRSLFLYHDFRVCFYFTLHFYDNCIEHVIIRVFDKKKVNTRPERPLILSDK